MKNIERGTVKYLILLIVAVSVCGMILYPLFDLIYYKFIAHTEFVYSVYRHITQPILFACVFGTTFWLVDKKKI